MFGCVRACFCDCALCKYTDIGFELESGLAVNGDCGGDDENDDDCNNDNQK